MTTMMLSKMIVKSTGASLYTLEISSLRCYSTTALRLADTAPEGTKEVKKFPPPEFYLRRACRDGRTVFRADNASWFGGQARLARNDRLCPSRDLNFTPLDWANHKSPYRRFRHALNLFRSSTVQRLIFPDLTTVALISAGLAYYNEVILMGVDMLSISPTAFGGATSAIGLLAGFRLNASYGRYEECRIFWGDTNNSIRDLARETMMWMKDKDQQSRMLKLCKAYPVVLNFHLNAKGGHHNLLRTSSGPKKMNVSGESVHHLVKEEPEKEQEYSFEDRVHAEFMAELGDIYLDGKHEEDYVRLCNVKYSGANTPLEVLSCMGETIAGSVGTVDAIYVREMDEQCQRLCGAFGASERVLRTSLPTSFTRHSSRLMFFWTNALPFALYPALGPFGTLPAAMFTSWAIGSIDDIGVQLEEPFFVLPLRQYSDGMFDAIGQIERNYTPYVPPSVKGADDVVAVGANPVQESKTS
jgi:putative membrane protein